MTPTPKISSNKILVLIVFICASIMASLFVYKMRMNKATEPVLASDIGIVFPAAREVKSFELLAANNQTFSLKELQGHWTLLFFGFTHCSNVCPASLDMLNRAYGSLKKSYPNLQVVLISVDPERDTPASLHKYTTSFNPDFIGVTGKIEELHKLQSQFGIYAARDTTTPANNYQVMHTASIMLINPQGEWSAMFKYGLSPEQFAEATDKSIKAAPVAIG